MKPAARGGVAVWVTLLASLLLAVFPLPDALDYLRPHFPLLVLAYWALMLPQRYGTWTGWWLGLIFDVLRATPLGAHALAFAVAGFAASRISARLKVYPAVQQALAVALLAGLSLMLLRLLGRFTGMTPPGLFSGLLLPVLMTGLAWVPAQVLLERVRRRYNVS